MSVATCALILLIVCFSTTHACSVEPTHPQTHYCSAEYVIKILVKDVKLVYRRADGTFVDENETPEILVPGSNSNENPDLIPQPSEPTPDETKDNGTNRDPGGRTINLNGSRNTSSSEDEGTTVSPPSVSSNNEPTNGEVAHEQPMATQKTILVPVDGRIIDWPNISTETQLPPIKNLDLTNGKAGSINQEIASLDREADSINGETNPTNGNVSHEQPPDGKQFELSPNDGRVINWPEIQTGQSLPVVVEGKSNSVAGVKANVQPPDTPQAELAPDARNSVSLLKPAIGENTPTTEEISHEQPPDNHHAELAPGGGRLIKWPKIQTSGSQQSVVGGSSIANRTATNNQVVKQLELEVSEDDKGPGPDHVISNASNSLPTVQNGHSSNQDPIVNPTIKKVTNSEIGRIIQNRHRNIETIAQRRASLIAARLAKALLVSDQQASTGKGSLRSQKKRKRRSSFHDRDIPPGEVTLLSLPLTAAPTKTLSLLTSHAFFSGSMVSAPSAIREPRMLYKQYTITVLKTLKGNKKLYNNKYLYTPPSEGLCGVTLKRNSRYVIIANSYVNGFFTVTTSDHVIDLDQLNDDESRNMISNLKHRYSRGCENCTINVCMFACDGAKKANECRWQNPVTTYHPKASQFACVPNKRRRCHWVNSLEPGSTPAGLDRL